MGPDPGVKTPQPRPKIFISLLAIYDVRRILAVLGRKEAATHLTLADHEASALARLAVVEPEFYEPLLADALADLGWWHGELADLPNAIAAGERAAEAFRRLDAVDADTYRCKYVGSLNNLASYLQDAGSLQTALGIAVDAVELHHAHLERKPADHTASCTLIEETLAEIRTAVDACATDS